MIIGPGLIITYDEDNQPDSISKGGTTTTFVYDGDGARVKKSDGTTTTTYIGQIYVCEGTTPPLSCVKFIFVSGQRIAMVQVPSGSTSYFHADHLGSTSVLTDSNGISEEDNTYYPYGDTYTHTGTSDVAYKYTGKERDSTTDLYFYEARYYDPVLGRFLTPDTFVPNARNPQSFNRYSYANNNPIIFIDPTGHFFKSISKFFKKNVGSIVTVGFTLAGQPYVGAFLGAAISTATSGGSIKDFAINVGIGVVAGYAGGGISGSIARSAGFNMASLGAALIRGSVTGAISGAGGAAIYKGNIFKGAISGGLSGAATSSVIWGYRDFKTDQFIKDHVNFDDALTTAQKAALTQAVKEAGQSPIGQELMSGFRKAESTLYIYPDHPDAGISSYFTKNKIYFQGNVQKSQGADFAMELWGPSMDDATAFIHELGHSVDGGNTYSEQLNTSLSENRYRGWIGTPLRNDYAYVRTSGATPMPVPNRPFLHTLWQTW